MPGRLEYLPVKRSMQSLRARCCRSVDRRVEARLDTARCQAVPMSLACFWQALSSQRLPVLVPVSLALLMEASWCWLAFHSYLHGLPDRPLTLQVMPPERKSRGTLDDL